VFSAAFDSSAPGSAAADAPHRRLRGDAGVVDAGMETLFGGVALIAIVLLLVETVSFWHADDVVDFLRDHLDQFVDRWFFELAIDCTRRIEYRNEANCPVARDPVESALRSCGCSAGIRQCRVRPLLVAGKRLAADIEGGWAIRRPEAVAALSHVPSDRRRTWRRSSGAVGQSVCWPLGDLVIANELSESEQLLTTDPDFVEIGQARNLNVVLLIDLV
jgi:hypothetical protein